MIGDCRANPESLSLRISVTDRCQLRCRYCMPPEGVFTRRREDVLRFEEIARFVQFVGANFALGKVHLTGGEPLIRPGLPALVEMLARTGARDMALTTNGQRLAALARPLRRVGLGRVNISLDSLNPATYRRLTRGADLGKTLSGIEAARRCGFSPIKLNMVVLRGVNDAEVVDLARFALESGLRIRFLELMPIGPSAGRFADWFVSSAEVRDRLAAAFELDPMDHCPGHSSRNYRARDDEGREGVVGFISSESAPFCHGCRRLRLTATGTLIGCLARNEGKDIRPLLRTAGPLDAPVLLETIEQALRAKRSDHQFAELDPMVSIGG